MSECPELIMEVCQDGKKIKNCACSLNIYLFLKVSRRLPGSFEEAYTVSPSARDNTRMLADVLWPKIYGWKNLTVCKKITFFFQKNVENFADHFVQRNRERRPVCELSVYCLERTHARTGG